MTDAEHNVQYERRSAVKAKSEDIDVSRIPRKQLKLTVCQFIHIFRTSVRMILFQRLNQETRKKKMNVERGEVNLSFYSLASDIVLDLEMFGGFLTWHIKMEEVFIK